MSRPSRSSGGVLVVLGALTVFFLAEQLARDTWLFSDVITRGRVAPFAALAKMAPELLGCIFAARCAHRHGPENPARAAWTLMSAWLGCWFAGQAVLSTYAVVLREGPPVPSWGDLFYTAGYGFVILALLAFVRAYRASGFAAGSVREDGLIALGACAVFCVLGAWILVPVALAPTPLGARLVAVGYPVLDLVALIPALVLLRITVAFRGGSVWRVWATLLAGILFAMGGDTVFSTMTAANVSATGPLADLLFILGYSFCGLGTRLQYELVTE